MEKRRFKFVIPAMVVVGIASAYMLINKYSGVPTTNKVLIVTGAVLLSGVLAYFLFPTDDESKPDDRGPY